MAEASSMFKFESDMAEIVVHWLSASRMAVKSEFVTPWGICDLVGLKFNPSKVNHRIKLGQLRPVSSVTRAMMLLEVPDLETGCSISSQRLQDCFKNGIEPEVFDKELCRLLKDGFIIKNASDNLQKLNGWMPVFDDLVAVELKLTRIEEAMQQALSNLAFAKHSYIALPSNVALRVAAQTTRWKSYLDAGVGLLAVSKSCRILIQSRRSDALSNAAMQLYCAEKFWASRAYKQFNKRASATASGRRTSSKSRLGSVLPIA